MFITNVESPLSLQKRANIKGAETFVTYCGYCVVFGDCKQENRIDPKGSSNV